MGILSPDWDRTTGRATCFFVAESTPSRYVLRSSLLAWGDLADDDRLAAAQKELKADAAQSARERQIAWLNCGGLEEMADPDQCGGVWR